MLSVTTCLIDVYPCNGSGVPIGGRALPRHECYWNIPSIAVEKTKSNHIIRKKIEQALKLTLGQAWVCKMLAISFSWPWHLRAGGSPLPRRLIFQLTGCGPCIRLSWLGAQVEEKSRTKCLPSNLLIGGPTR